MRSAHEGSLLQKGKSMLFPFCRKGQASSRCEVFVSFVLFVVTVLRELLLGLIGSGRIRHVQLRFAIEYEYD